MEAREFYAVTAQVIPVLMLALIFEMRVVERAKTLKSRVFAASIIWYLALGESFALAGLYTGNDPEKGRFLMIGSLVLGGTYLVGHIVGPPLDDLEALFANRRKLAVLVAFLTGLVWIVPWLLARLLFDF